MPQDIHESYQKYLVQNRHRNVLKRVVNVLACIVIFCTTYALILPAITMEKETFCGVEEHVHTEACYGQGSVVQLVCSGEKLNIHTHSSACYDAEGALVCGQADYVAHSHDAHCYNDSEELVCTIAERSVHVHGESCYAPAETQAEVLHVHSESCNSLQKGDLTCTLEEYEGHTHGDACYVPGTELLCTIEANHVHADGCYTYPLICELSTEPHNHSDSCYTAGDLVCTTVTDHVHGEECFELDLTCQNEEEGHVHDEACYTRISVCSIPEHHSHSGSCYASVLNCGKEQGEVHSHSDACYSTEARLVCEIPENHVHADSCYQSELTCLIPEDPGHAHGDDCYNWETVISCGMEEGQPEPTEPAEPVLVCTEPIAQVHVHADGCFETVVSEPTPICGSTETDHVHTEECYRLNCGLEEHTHSLSCYSDPEADVETAEIWEATLADVELTGKWPEDVVAIAESQLGYTESTRNYAVWEDNSIHGYTRYGAWYGVPHGDWCGMFASFCLNYAGVEGMPLNYGVRPWIEDLAEMGLYYTAGTAEPQKGHLVFYDWEGDGLSDHVGIVAEIEPATEYSVARLKAIEGNASNCVKYVTYDLDDPVLLGYSRLPEKPEVEEEEKIEVQEELEEEQPVEPSTVTASIYTDETYSTVAEDNTVITLTGILPEGAKVYAYPVVVESELEFVCAYDISILLPDGTLHEPAEGEMISVNISNLALETSEAELEVYYIPEEGEPNLLESDVESGSVVFDTDHFSVYGVAEAAVFSTQDEIAANSVTASIYTDETYNTIATDTTTAITISGLPEGVTVKAFPKKISSEALNIKLAYDIKLYNDDDTVYTLKDGESATVTIEDSAIAAAEGKLTVYYFPGEGEPKKVETIVSGSAVTFTTNHFSTYGLDESAVVTAVFYENQWSNITISNPNKITVTGVPSDTVVKAYPIIVTEERIGVLCSYQIKFYEADGTTAFTPTDAEVKIQYSGEAGADAPYTVYEFIYQWSFGSRKACKANLTSSPFTFNTSYSDYCYAVTYVPVSNIVIPVYPDSKTNTPVDGVTMTATGRFPTAYSMRAYADFATATKNVLYSYRIFSHEQYNYAKEIPYDGPEITISITNKAMADGQGALTLLEYPDSGEPVEITATMDTDTNTVSFTTDHLSTKYALVDSTELNTEATVKFYTDSSFATEVTDGPEMTVTGAFLESMEVRAYPVNIYRNSDIICGYHVGLYQNNQLISEAIPLSVAFTHADLLNAAETPKKLNSVSADQKTLAANETAEFDTVNGSVAFQMNANTIFALEMDTDGVLTEVAIDFAENSTYVAKYDAITYVSSDDAVYGYESFYNTQIILQRGNQWNTTKPYKGTEEMTVRITTEQFKDLTDFEILLVKGSDKTKIETFEHTNNVISFTTTPDKIADCNIAVVKPLEEIDETVTTAEDFIKYVNSGAPEITVTLDADIELTLEEALKVQGPVIIDLHGNRITVNGDQSLFDVAEGGELTIKDTAAPDETVETISGLASNNAHVADASLNDNGVSLDYYITVSTPSNSAVGRTTETVRKHTVRTNGVIIADSAPLIKVEKGTVTLESGVLYGGTGRAIHATDNSVLNLEGGYIAGFELVNSNRGGAIHMNTGNLNLSGTVLAGNYASSFGGAANIEKATVIMTDGAVTGNDIASADVSNGSSASGYTYEAGGAGMCLSGTTFTLDGGYITNNNCRADGYWAGGGGLLAQGGGNVNLSGGYVTGNEANAGGGIKLNDTWGGSTTVLNMDGSMICSNTATYGEGGGINIGAGNKGYFYSGYINNNRTDCRIDWGGGGVFIANDANAYMENLLTTQNSAGGFGAGVAGCSTARMHISLNKGAAIYGNTASGQNTSGAGSTKNEDWLYAKDSPVFMAHGYQDVFSALNCTVEGAILGGGIANWQGTCDGEVVSSSNKEDMIYSQYILGLTSSPNSAAKGAAEEAAELFITGNSSYTHGGGILCNGYLLIGVPEEGSMDVGARIEVRASKAYQDAAGNSQPMTDNQFQFVIKDSEGNTVSTGNNKSTGAIIFNNRLPFNGENTYVYTITEEQGKDPSIVYDPAQYRLTVTTHVTTFESALDSNITVRQTLVDSILVEKWDAETDNWIEYLRNDNVANHDNKQIDLDLGDKTFVNVIKDDEDTDLSVKKEWADNVPEDKQQTITVKLMEGDAVSSRDDAEIQLSADNKWTYKWSELPIADADGKTIQYSVEEVVPDGFTADYSSGLDENDDVLITITNKLKTYGIELLKTNTQNVALPGAEFQLKDASGNVLSFVKSEQDAYVLVTETSESASSTLVTDNDGKLKIENLSAGTYTFEETKAPLGYKEAQPKTITVNGDTVDDNGIYSLTIIDQKIDYELPHTGGVGTTLYTMSGMLLIAVALVMYIQTKRKREAV